jgi:hypothetical protein
MKLSPKFLVVLVLVGVLMTYAGCKPHHDNPVPVTDTQIDLLTAKTWIATGVTLDANPETAYTSSSAPFTLKFSGTHGQTTINYTATNRPALSAWPASGTMTFDTTTPTTNLTRNDTAPVAVVYSVSATQLVLHFTYTGAGYSRTTEVDGQWIFSMAAQ